MAKMVHFGEFVGKPEARGQTVLPDRSVLIGQKLGENAKIQKFNCEILSNFQTMCWNEEETWILQNGKLTDFGDDD